MKSKLVYAVFLRKNYVCNPTTEEIMTLRAVKVRESNGHVRTQYVNTDTNRPFYTYANSSEEKRAMFSFTGVHLNQDPGRMWLFTTRKKAEGFREGMFAYKIFLGACLSGDDSLV